MTSAGLDLSLILTPVASPLPASTSSKRKQPALPPNPVSNNPGITFESTVHRRQAYVPQRNELPFSITTNPDLSENGRLLVARKERSVSMWRLGEAALEGEGDGKGWEKLIDLEFKVSYTLFLSIRRSVD